MATEPFSLKVWKCHPSSGRVIPAERDLHGYAHEGGLKFCGPYTYANKSGFWMFSPVDMDVCWKGGKEFEVRFHQEYDDADYHILRSLLIPKDNVQPDMWCLEGGRSKFTWGMVEDGVIQMWTGLIFETPPGWALHIRSPINFPPRSCYVMEGILETDFMQQDIWANIVFTRPGDWVEFRRDSYPPLVQLVPVRREGFAENWKCSEEMINRDSPEANRVFEYWIQFNEKKFGKGGKQALTPDMTRTKDSSTFYKERGRCLAGGMEPKPEQILPKECPFHKSDNRTVVYCMSGHAMYQKMALNSIKMLRKHNEKISVQLIFVEGEEETSETLSFIHNLKLLNVKFNRQSIFRPETRYFSLNKYWLTQIMEDSVLYLDVDTFINGDVEVLFDKYKTDFTAIESKWVYEKGWEADFLPNKCKPVNSGVQLFHGGYHHKMFSRLLPTFDILTSQKTPLGKWAMAYHDGCLREELACSLILAEDNANYLLFKPQDCYNIERVEDVPRCHDPIIFHSYTRQWDMVKRWSRATRKMIWPKQSKSGKVNLVKPSVVRGS